MLLRRVARPLIAGIFVYGGVAALRDPGGHAKAAQPVLDGVAGRVPLDRPPSQETLVRVDAGVKIGAGVLFGLGKAPRLSALALAGSLVPTTAAAHRFWEIEDPQERETQKIQFLKNLSLLGGLMVAAADTEGKPSLAWRARRAGRTSQATAELFHRDVTEGLGELAERASRARGQALTAAGQAGDRLGSGAGVAGERLGTVAGVAGERLGTVAGVAGERLGTVAGVAGDRLGAAAEVAGERLGVAGERLGTVAGVAGERLTDLAGQVSEKTGPRARKRAAKRTAKRLDQVSKQADKRIQAARTRAAKQADKRIKVARKRATAQARRVRSSLPVG